MPQGDDALDVVAGHGRPGTQSADHRRHGIAAAGEVLRIPSDLQQGAPWLRFPRFVAKWVSSFNPV
jgi:hypothetical protein